MVSGAPEMCVIWVCQMNVFLGVPMLALKVYAKQPNTCKVECVREAMCFFAL